MSIEEGVSRGVDASPGRAAGCTTRAADRSPGRVKVVVIGQGHIGLPVALRSVDAGYEVVGYDNDKRVVSGLSSGRSHLADVTDAELEEALASGRFRPSESEADLAHFDVAILAVPTPRVQGVVDLSAVEAAASMVAAWLNKGAVVVLESSVHPGTTEETVAPLLEAGSGLWAGRDFAVGYSPQRIDPGNEVWDFQAIPKLVAGIDDESLVQVDRFYRTLVATTVPMRGTREAELADLLEGTFRQVNIALANEMAVLARSLGVDFWNALDGASTKPFGFMPFRPGPGVGGNALPIDLANLAAADGGASGPRAGTGSKLARLATDINRAMPAAVVERVQAGLNRRRKPVKGSRILVLGLAHKKNASDSRESPAIEIVDRLWSMGAEVRAFDSHAGPCEVGDEVQRIDDLHDQEIQAADAVVLLTDHDDVDYGRVAELAQYVFDTRRRLPESTEVERL